MKRKTALLCAAFAVLALGSCAMSAPLTVFDKDLPKEESAMIYFIRAGGIGNSLNGIYEYSWMDVTSYNGIPVPVKKDKSSSYGVKSEWRYVSIPPGEMEFEFSGISGNNPIYVVKDITFKYTFLPGEYVLFFTAFGGTDNNAFGINIYEQSVPIKYNRQGVILENFIAFVPLSISKNTVFQ